MSKFNFFKNQKKLNRLALALIFLFFLLIVVLSAVGYSNVLSIVAPVSLFIGFWIWMSQERIKRRADAAEDFIRKYDAYEATIISLWRDGVIKNYSPDGDNKNFDNFKLIIDVIIEKREKCNIAKRELESSIKILVRRNNIDYTYTEIANLINEFNSLNHFLHLYNKIESVEIDGYNFPAIARAFDNIDAYVDCHNFGTDPSRATIFDKPRDAIEKHTKGTFNLLVL